MQSKNIKGRNAVLSLPALLKKCQIVFNRWIRNRDRDKGCISCGAEVTEAGHYYSQGHHSALRFNEVNTNGQCQKCNRFLSGNLIHYRFGILKRHGQQKLDLLDSVGTRNKAYKFSRAELEQIILQYQIK
jgi:hypothetical protein